MADQWLWGKQTNHLLSGLIQEISLLGEDLIKKVVFQSVQVSLLLMFVEILIKSIIAFKYQIFISAKPTVSHFPFAPQARN